MKKLLGQQFGTFYALSKERLAKKNIAAYTMAEIEASTGSALDVVKMAVNDCNGTFGPITIFASKTTRMRKLNTVF